MATTTRNRRTETPPARDRKSSDESVVSIRLSREVLSQVDELAQDMERSRASVLARAVREYVEQEYGRLVDLREAERELNAGKGVPHAQLGDWLTGLKAGKGRPAELK
jgi:predicted transcriptional regulator